MPTTKKPKSAPVVPPAVAHEDRLGKAAYEAYCGARNWKSFDGKPLPAWADVQTPIRVAWMAAGKAAMLAGPHPSLAEAVPVTIYFGTRADADAFVELVKTTRGLQETRIG